ncbi:MAG: tyrosine-type recombinase/integrase [Phycisphaerales bacterium]|nr:MAG: tyrosine-type recombinase/integrase [Phycisphaerales bacterium]
MLAQSRRTSTEARAIVDLRAGRVLGVRAWMLVDLALSTGLRVSEIAALNIKDVDLKRGCLSIVRLKRKKKVRETLALGKDTAQHLKEYIAWTGQKKGRLFVGSRGPLSAQGLQRIWKRSVELAGLPEELSIHSARHTIAVQLLKKTGNLRQAQKQLGHASPATTANMYADISFEDMQNGLNGLYK